MAVSLAELEGLHESEFETMHESEYEFELNPVRKVYPDALMEHMAHMVIHSLRQFLAPGCLPLFTSDGLNLYFYAARGPFWLLAPGWSPRTAWTPVAGGGRPQLRPGEAKLTFGASWFV